jgi:hypothetical protein
MTSIEAVKVVTGGKSQRRRIVVRITQQCLCRDFGDLNGGFKISRINHSWNMITGLQSVHVFRSKYFLQSFHILSTEFSRLVPFKMQIL